MSTNELNLFLNSFDRPQDLSDAAWNHVIAQAQAVWKAYLNGQDWRNTLEINCKESYLMLVSKEGKLIVEDESLLHYVRNEQITAWRKHLENIAFNAIRDKKLDKAERFFTKAIKVDATQAMNYYRRALLRMKALRHKEALEDLTHAIQLNGEVAAFYMKRSTIYRLLDLDYKAMSDMNKAIKVDPRHAEAFELRGKFRLSIGDRAGARMDLLKAKELRDQGNVGGGEHYASQAA
jgi:tetratricopeptide (TPR) repeat protein